MDQAAAASSAPSGVDVSTETCSVGVFTEPEFLGPCDPGTSVCLQGIVWHEQTDAGLIMLTIFTKKYISIILVFFRLPCMFEFHYLRSMKPIMSKVLKEVHRNWIARLNFIHTTIMGSIAKYKHLKKYINFE